MKMAINLQKSLVGNDEEMHNLKSENLRQFISIPLATKIKNWEETLKAHIFDEEQVGPFVIIKSWRQLHYMHYKSSLMI